MGRWRMGRWRAELVDGGAIAAADAGYSSRRGERSSCEYVYSAFLFKNFVIIPFLLQIPILIP